METLFESGIVCDYGPLTMTELFVELNKMMRGVLPGGVIRAISHRRESREHILAWCLAHEHTLLWQRESRECGRDFCMAVCEFVIQRGPQ